jgi:hypothetical protein
MRTRFARCPIRLFSTKQFTQVDLTDAISRHGYAFWICASREAFDAFTAQYMQ